MQDGYEFAFFRNVDNLVDAKASNFNKVQQTSTSRRPAIQQQTLKINKNP
jgi:hypothetical protein